MINDVITRRKQTATTNAIVKRMGLMVVMIARRGAPYLAFYSSFCTSYGVLSIDPPAAKTAKNMAAAKKMK